MLQSPVTIREGELKIENEPVTIYVVKAEWKFIPDQSILNATFKGDIPPLKGNHVLNQMTIVTRLNAEDDERLELIRQCKEGRAINISLHDQNTTLNGSLTPTSNPDVERNGQNTYITLHGSFKEHQA